MDGHATLEQLLNAPAGTVFKERRHGGTIRIDGAEYRMGRGYRSTGHAPKPAWTFEQRLRQLEEAGLPNHSRAERTMPSAASALAPEGPVEGKRGVSLIAPNGHTANRHPPFGPAAVPSSLPTWNYLRPGQAGPIGKECHAKESSSAWRESPRRQHSSSVEPSSIEARRLGEDGLGC